MINKALLEKLEELEEQIEDLVELNEYEYSVLKEVLGE